MQRLEFSVTVLPIYGSLGVKRLTTWNSLGHSRPVTGLLYLYRYQVSKFQLAVKLGRKEYVLINVLILETWGAHSDGVLSFVSLGVCRSACRRSFRTFTRFSAPPNSESSCRLLGTETTQKHHWKQTPGRKPKFCIDNFLILTFTIQSHRTLCFRNRMKRVSAVCLTATRHKPQGRPFLIEIWTWDHSNTRSWSTSNVSYDASLLFLFILLLLLLSLSSSSSSSPLCRVFIFIFLIQTMSLGNTVLQLFCCYYSWCLYR